MGMGSEDNEKRFLLLGTHVFLVTLSEDKKRLMPQNWK
jgi:hypothetical protein